jgi:oxygen-independent coproporphyrinogen-3 oxidase
MQLLSQTVQFDADLLQRYNKPVPRYTSYPPATELSDNFQPSQFSAAILAGNRQQTPISLYCHIPFCETPCYFCGCNTIITQRKEVADPYLDYIFKNIEQTAVLVDSQRKVNQLHWGGGTPNYLKLYQLAALWKAIQDNFQFTDDAEISIEINPKFVDRNYILFLKDIGFNRISFGIQDFNPKVQEAINRVQPEATLFNVMDWIREAGFESVNVDLIYGLPYQTLRTFQQTVKKTIELDPDRIAVFNFAYVPWLKPIQKRIPQAALPSAAGKLEIFHTTIDELTANGYVFIGMDHFAKPNDELTLAQQAGQLHRNFQGYTTKPESDLLGFGITSISMLQNVYTQNHKRLKSYYQSLDAAVFPIEKGVSLCADDLIRRAVIMELMCQFQLSKSEFSNQYHIEFDGYFARELSELEWLESDGLVELNRDLIQVTPAGRLLIRNIASVFDAYLKHRQFESFSKAI